MRGEDEHDLPDVDAMAIRRARVVDEARQRPDAAQTASRDGAVGDDFRDERQFFRALGRGCVFLIRRADVLAKHAHLRRVFLFILARRRQSLENRPIGRVRARSLVKTADEVLFHRLAERRRAQRALHHEQISRRDGARRHQAATTVGELGHSNRTDVIRTTAETRTHAVQIQRSEIVRPRERLRREHLAFELDFFQRRPNRRVLRRVGETRSLICRLRRIHVSRHPVQRHALLINRLQFHRLIPLRALQRLRRALQRLLEHSRSQVALRLVRVRARVRPIQLQRRVIRRDRAEIIPLRKLFVPFHSNRVRFVHFLRLLRLRQRRAQTAQSERHRSRARASTPSPRVSLASASRVRSRVSHRAASSRAPFAVPRRVAVAVAVAVARDISRALFVIHNGAPIEPRASRVARLARRSRAHPLDDSLALALDLALRSPRAARRRRLPSRASSTVPKDRLDSYG